MSWGGGSLGVSCDPCRRGGGRFVVGGGGRFCQLVAGARRAWYAGVGGLQGGTDINARSIGIEIVNPGHEFGYRPFPPQQMAAVKLLALDILARHPVPTARVLGHSDVAPLRKDDPGELFDWRGLAAAGIGLWPETGSSAVLESAVGKALARVGYSYTDENLPAVIREIGRAHV